MLTELARFEWRYHTRQPSFMAACALFFLLGFVMIATGFGPANVLVTSPWLVTEVLAFASLFSVFTAALFVANAAIRDADHRMEEIVFTTPVGRFPYLFGRFGGALAANISAIALAPIGMVLATLMPSLDRARVGPLHAATFLWPLLTIVLPTLLFVTALLFTFAVLTRSALATYTASVFIYILYLAGAALTNSPLMAASRPGAGGSGIAAALLDPFGMSSFFELTRYWTTAEKNSRLIPLTGALLLNRAIWIGVAVVLCAIAYRSFSFRLLGRKKVKAEKKEPPPATLTPYAPAEPAPRSLASFWSATKLETGTALRSRPFQLLLALWFILAVTEIRSDLSGEYGSASYAATALIVETLLQPLMIVGLIIVIYYGSELFWREHRFRMAAIVDATPVRGATMALAKWSAITTLIAATTALGIAAGIVVQATHGYFAFQPQLYLSLFYFAGLPLALYAAAAVAIHALSPGKYAGLALVLFFILGTRNIAMAGLEHPLWRFGWGPQPSYSAMYGFGDTTFGSLMLFWSVWAVAMIGVAALLWRRLGSGSFDRIRALSRFIRTNGRKPVAVLVVALAVTGALAFYETNVVRVYQPRGRALEWRADYERRYRPLAAMPQPRITTVTTAVDIFPSERRARIAGEYLIRNDHDRPLQTILVTLPRGASDVSVDVPSSRRSSDRTTDSRFGVHRFDLDHPLRPNDQTKVSFAMTLGDGVEQNGTVLMTSSSFPSLGYRANYEITDPRERAKRRLGTSSTPEVADSDAASSTSEMERVTLDATVSTSSDQTAITSGHLDRQWTANGRRWFHYRSDAPMRNRFTFLSARYAIATAKAGDVDVTIAYHAAHSANVKAMLDAAVRTLDYCSNAFGRYPYRQLKLAEAPSSGFGGYALPDTILFSEQRMFLVDARDANRPDLVTRRVAHEVAHQWWGYQLVPQSRGGATTLTESLAKYTELMMLERLRGRDQVRELLDIELDRYLAGRSREEQRERTLANAGDQPYIYYSKGALVFQAVRDLIGEDALNAALRKLLDENREAATTLDLLRQLRNVSTPAQFAIIDEWFEKIVLYELAVDTVDVKPLPGGSFRVGAHVSAAKREAAENGVEHDVPLDESIDVALFRSGGIDSANLVATQRVPMHTGANEIAFVTREKPTFVVADPELLRIDRNRADNVKRVD